MLMNVLKIALVCGGIKHGMSNIAVSLPEIRKEWQKSQYRIQM